VSRWGAAAAARDPPPLLRTRWAVTIAATTRQGRYTCRVGCPSSNLSFSPIRRFGLDLILELRDYLPWVAILYLANRGRSTPELERRLPGNVPILSEPFTADELRAAVPLSRLRAIEELDHPGLQ
jgi:hypothetical protein